MADNTDSIAVAESPNHTLGTGGGVPVESSSTNSSICSGASGKENTNHHHQQQQQQHHHQQQKEQQQQKQDRHQQNQQLHPQQYESLNGSTSVIENNVENVNTSISPCPETTKTTLETHQEFSKTKKKNKNKMKRPLNTNFSQEKELVSDKKDNDSGGRESSNGKDVGVPLSSPIMAKPSQSSNTTNNISSSEPSLSFTSPPPPGFHVAMSNLTLETNDESDTVVEPVVQDIAGDLMSGLHPPIHQSMSSAQDLYIVIPDIDRPIYHASPIQPSSPMPLPGLSRPSLAIPAAKAFVDLYYRHLTLGQYSDLCRYYTPNAQKSISVGGAHSVVATRSDIMLQLQSLSQSMFIVRGVVSQDTYDGRGAHILITGVVQTGEVLTQFAHSVGLVAAPPQHGLFSFQIHNDALSLLTGGEDVVTSRGDDVRGRDEQAMPVQNGGGQERWKGDMSTNDTDTFTDGFSKSCTGVSRQTAWHQ